CHASTHAAGIVISREPLTRHVPLQQVSKSEGSDLVMTQYTMENIARIGLLKMDFLGLANLTILGKAQNIIQESRGIDLDLYRLPMDDQKTFDLLSAGETTGVFQLESSGMRRYIRELRPTCFSDIAAMVALYRPGPMEHIPTFIRSKQGLEPIRYPHPALENILEETYGVIVYQDQVLFIVRQFAGYSLGQADIFRKAMGKKIPEVMQKEKVNFINGAKNLGYSEEIAETIFALIEPFAGYAFNKAHSVSYALIAYQTAYLKANFPSEYMTAFLIGNTDMMDKIGTAISECRRLEIKVLPPDINRSQVTFSLESSGDPEKPDIRFGLAAIKNVGPGAVEPLIAERSKNGPFKSIEDLCRRMDGQCANRRVLESLIKAGALDCLGDRGALFNSVDRILSLAQAEQKMRSSGQVTMFDVLGQSSTVSLPGLELNAGEVSVKEKLVWEKELIGVYLSEHPFARYRDIVNNMENTVVPSQVNAEMDGQEISLVGMVSSFRELLTKDRRAFCSAALEDDSGAGIELMAWTRVYEDTRGLWQEGNILRVNGKVRIKEDQVQVTCDSAELFKPDVAPAAAAGQALKEMPKTAGIGKIGGSGKNGGNGKMVNGHNGKPSAAPAELYRLTITIHETENDESDEAFFSRVMEILKGSRGRDEVYLRVINLNRVTHLKMTNSFVEYSPDLQKRLSELVKAENLIVEKISGC
ncbi:MAG: DNA polymerase III subunit alpha, partial [Dehalococcoidales bacterium]|nr:DNA polymerase III subunit alpha [Dehalococcoidales bacterium]